MFGNNYETPKCVKQPKRPHFDINLTSVHPGVYGHMGRQANSNYFVRMLHYKQRQHANLREQAECEANRLKCEEAQFKYAKHSEHRYNQQLIDKRIEEKLKQYEDSLKIRQQKLKALFCEEQRQYNYETVEQSQKACDLQLESLKTKTRELEEKRERERLAYVEKRKLEQFKERCIELRPSVWRAHLIDTKQTQLAQMEEKREREAAEKELEKMWFDLMQKEIESKEERAKQELLKQHSNNREMLDTWAKQLHGKQLLQEQIQRCTAEDKFEMDQLQMQLRCEHMSNFNQNMENKRARAAELKAQIDKHQEYLNEYRQAEDALDQEFARLARVHEQEDRDRLKKGSENARREISIYREHLRDLEAARHRENIEYEQLLDQHRRAIEAKQDEARCRLKAAREQLHKNVLAGRAEQLVEKRQRHEIELEVRQVENELLRLDCLAYERETEEQKRLVAEANRRHCLDLKRQMDENIVKRDKERDRLRNELETGLAEERKYMEIVQDLIAKNEAVDPDMKQHPFRNVLETGQKRPNCCIYENQRI